MNGIYFFIFGEFFAIGRMRSPDRQRETERQKARNQSPGVMATPQSLLLHSPLRILGTHTHTHTRAQREFKPPGPGLELQSTTWQSSDIAIIPTAGPAQHYF